MINRSCSFSFDDLHLAALGRAMTAAEKQKLYSLPQGKRNQVVGEWAKKAQWRSEVIIGADGHEYLTFWQGDI